MQFKNHENVYVIDKWSIYHRIKSRAVMSSQFYCVMKCPSHHLNNLKGVPIVLPISNYVVVNQWFSVH